jgi:transcriptional regulator with XRE-family HTH domain
MGTRTAGAAQLGAITAPLLSTEEVASACGVSVQSVRNWIRGTSKPAAVRALALEVELGIPIASWREDAGAIDTEADALLAEVDRIADGERKEGSYGGK